MEAILICGGNIDVQWRQYCLVREIAKFSERHVTRVRPITCTHFEMRYNNVTWETLLSIDWSSPLEELQLRVLGDQFLSSFHPKLKISFFIHEPNVRDFVCFRPKWISWVAMHCHWWILSHMTVRWYVLWCVVQLSCIAGDSEWCQFWVMLCWCDRLTELIADVSRVFFEQCIHCVSLDCYSSCSRYRWLDIIGRSSSWALARPACCLHWTPLPKRCA